MDAEELKTTIANAFKGVTLGDGIGLWEAQAIDDYETYVVRAEKRRGDQKFDWQEISHDELRRCYSSLCFFDADGMRFHLPAFLLAEIDGEFDQLVFHLTDLDDYKREKLMSLNDSQKSAVVEFLEWCLESDRYEYEHHSITATLKNFWLLNSSKNIES
ncbi:MAG: DUF6714 family protein [Cyanobacteria bacterium P01_E01_bin.34]